MAEMVAINQIIIFRIGRSRQLFGTTVDLLQQHRQVEEHRQFAQIESSLHV